MTNKLFTRPVHCEADLDNLVAGDRVILDVLNFNPLPGDPVGDKAPAAYGGRVGQKILLLESIGKEVREISATVEHFSFDHEGVMVVSSNKLNCKSYDVSSSDYENKLMLLKKAGIYHG